MIENAKQGVSQHLTDHERRQSAYLLPSFAAQLEWMLLLNVKKTKEMIKDFRGCEINFKSISILEELQINGASAAP